MGIGYTPRVLKLHGTDPLEFLKLFENNGYKIFLNNFFDKDIIPLEKILEKRKINLYIVHSSILED